MVNRAPARLTASLLAAYRPGSLVAVALGMAANLPRKRPRGYTVHARAQTAPGGPRAPLPPPAPGTAVVRIVGVLEQRANAWSCGETCGYDTIEADLCEALSDPGVGSVVIACDTPGGDVPGLEEATARIRAVVDALGKPVIGYADELVASAGVYLMLGVCDRLYLPRSGRIGSISSACIFQSEARALRKAGIDTYIARGLPGKMDPNPLEPLSPLGKARLDAHALECSERFIAFVAQRRGIDPETIRSWSADIFTGEAAVTVGLADGIGSLEGTIALAGELAALKEAA